MTWPGNLRKWVVSVTVVQRSEVSPMVESKPSLINFLTVPHPDAFLSIPIVEFNEWMVQRYPPLPRFSTPFRLLDAFRKEHMCTLKRFLFLSICRFFHLVFPSNRHGVNVGRISWAFFSGTRTVEIILKHFWMRHCLIQLNTWSLIQIVTYFFSAYISAKNCICRHQWLQWFNVQ